MRNQKNYKKNSSEIDVFLTTEMGLYNYLKGKNIRFNPQPFSNPQHPKKKKRDIASHNLVDLHIEIVKKIDALLLENEKNSNNKASNIPKERLAFPPVEIRDISQKKPEMPSFKTEIELENITNQLARNENLGKTKLTTLIESDLVQKSDESPNSLMIKDDETSQKLMTGFAKVKVREKSNETKPKKTQPANISKNNNHVTKTKKELEKTKQEIEKKKQELEEAEKQAKKKEEELKIKQKEKSEKEKKDEKLREIKARKKEKESAEKAKLEKREKKLQAKKELTEAKIREKELKLKKKEREKKKKLKAKEQLKAEKLERIKEDKKTKEEKLKEKTTKKKETKPKKTVAEKKSGLFFGKNDNKKSKDKKLKKKAKKLKKKNEKLRSKEEIKKEKTSKEESFDSKKEMDALVLKEKLLDEDVKKLLPIIDNLLEKLPDEVIDEFAQSDDFELYEKVMTKYKNK